jgi:hypothetical protein
VTATGSQVLVTGLAPGQSSDVTVTASSAGYTNASATETGAALRTGTTPTLSTPVSTVDGFTFDITNFTPGDAYTFSATNGGSVLLTHSTVTVTGFAPGTSSTVTVTDSRSGYADASASQAGSTLQTGAAPTASAPVSTLDGYTFVITNYDPSTNYTFTATDGATVTNNGAAVTVTGLAPGAGSTVTISAVAAGFTGSSLDVPGSTLLIGVAPIFGVPTRTADGFTFRITNFDPSVLYSFSVPSGAIVTINGSQVVVSGLPAGGSATVSVSAALTGSADASASVTGTALDAAPTPTPTPTSTPTPTPTSTPTPAPTATPTPTPTPTLTSAPSVSPSPVVPTVLGNGSGASGNDFGPATFVTPTGTRSPTPAVSKSASSDSGGTDLATVELAPGTGAATIDGVKVTQTLTLGHAGVLLTAGGLTMELAANVNGHEVVLRPGEYLTVEQGGHLSVGLTGFKPGSKADIWGHSTPMHLDGFGIAGDRSGRAQFQLPSALKPGNHTLIATGWTANGKPAAMAIGIRILAAAAPIAAHHEAGTGTGFNWWWLLLLLLPVGVFGWYLLVWRRRDDDDESQSQSPGGEQSSSSPRGVLPPRRPLSELPGSPKGLPGQRAAAPEGESTRSSRGDE